VFSASPEATHKIAGELARTLSEGDVVLLQGPLGAGKTTFVRGLLEALGYDGPVRSPTFNLIQTFDTAPPVMHADLYRVRSWEGIGIEDYLESHVCLIEWPDRAKGLVDAGQCVQVSIEFDGAGRQVRILLPSRAENDVANGQ
jgi:tRNA threonylcarbamoyladenosine biosynthesis protein TsaE